MTNQKFCTLAAFFSLWTTTDAFVAPRPVLTFQQRQSVTFPLYDSSSNSDPIISPFDNSGDEGGAAASTSGSVVTTTEGPLELTWDNVEKVLDEMRPFLIQDGGNVAITEIDGPVVRLELQVRNNRYSQSTE